MHLNCVKADGQNVRYAKDVLSENVAELFRTLFPGDGAKLQLADLLSATHKVFNLFTSNGAENSEISKCTFGGINLQNQLEIISNFKNFISTMKFSGKPKFNTALLISIKATIELQECLSTNYSLPQLITSHITQERSLVHPFKKSDLNAHLILLNSAVPCILV